jgi:hypothetical protein
MTWYNLPLALLGSPTFLAAPQSALGVWLRVMRYACEQECGGRLRGAMKWTDRQWIAACNSSQAEIQAGLDARLLVADGDDVLIIAYPSNRQADVQALRADGAAGGRGRSFAKAEAARLNGRLGGRPRTREPEKPTVTERKPNETQPEKPTTTSPPDVASEKNPTEGKDKEKGSVCVQNTTTTHEGSEEWISRVRAEWPGVNLDRELRRARAYVQRARGEDAPLQRGWFESEWLPRCADPAAPDRIGPRHWPATASAAPEGWKDALSGSVYGVGGDREAKTWEELDPAVREFALRRMAESTPSSSA